MSRRTAHPTPFRRRAILRGTLLAMSTLLASCSHPAPPAATPRPSSVPAPQASAARAGDWRQLVPGPGPDTPWTYPAPHLTQLSNGVSVYWLPTSRGPVSLSLLLRHGGSDDPPGKSGLAALTAKMLVEATKAKNTYALSEAAEALGSTLTADANRDFIRLSIDTLPEDVATGISLLAESLTTPAFHQKDFARLQKLQLDDLAAERQAPARMASIVGLRAVLGEELGRPVGGRLSSVRRLTVADVRQWHERFTYPAAAALLVVGPIDEKQVLSAAERALGRLQRPAPKQEPVPTPSEVPATEVRVVDRPGSVQSSLFVVQLFPKRHEPGFAAREVLDNVIGGQFTSRINQNLREQHAYTYGARSSVIAARRFGLLTVATSVETNVTVPALGEIIRELRELRAPKPIRPVTPDELQRARTGVIQSVGAHLEDGHRLMSDAELLFVHGLEPSYMTGLLSEVRSIDEAALESESARLTPDRLVIVIVGYLTRIREELTSANLPLVATPVDWLD